MGDGLLSIRRAQPDDASDVWPLAQAFATSFELERPAFDESYRSLLGRADALLIVATTAHLGVAGYLLAHAHTTFLANGPVASIEEVMVDERVRRGGVGTALIGHAEGWAREVGARYVSLASRRAGPFYVRLGYENSAVFYRKVLGSAEARPIGGAARG